MNDNIIFQITIDDLQSETIAFQLKNKDIKDIKVINDLNVLRKKIH